MPGALVFLQNTGQPGLSNAGFYLGEGQFVSASPELGVVTIGHLDDPYWATAYLTARRLATEEPAG
jgi:cell wall-associated NlpC family hydrolase